MCHPRPDLFRVFLLHFHVSCFSACSITGGRKARLFRVVGLCLAVCWQEWCCFPLCSGGKGSLLPSGGFLTNILHPRYQKQTWGFMMSSWRMRGAKIRAPSIWQMQVKLSVWISSAEMSSRHPCVEVNCWFSSFSRIPSCYEWAVQGHRWVRLPRGKASWMSWNPFKYNFVVVFSEANSSSEVQVVSTENGIILSSSVTYYDENLRVGWLHKYETFP